MRGGGARPRLPWWVCCGLAASQVESTCLPPELRTYFGVYASARGLSHRGGELAGLGVNANEDMERQGTRSFAAAASGGAFRFFDHGEGGAIERCQVFSCRGWVLHALVSSNTLLFPGLA